jgi:hypothetical protein
MTAFGKSAMVALKAWAIFVRRWPFVFAILTCAIFLICMAFILVLFSFVTNYGDSMIKEPYVSTDAPFAPPYGLVSTVQKDDNSSRAVLELQIQKHSLTDSTITLGVQLSVPDDLRTQLWVGGFEGHALTQKEIEEQYPTGFITIELVDTFQPSSSISIPVPLKAVIPMERSGMPKYVFTTTLNVPVFGQQNMYPSDWYFYNGFVSLSIPPPFSLHRLKGNFEFNIPVETKVGLGIGMNGERLIVQQSPSRKNPYTDNVAFEILRDTQTRTYTYAMACVPIIFSAVLFHWFFWRGKRESIRSSILEALAASLAVLPLRVVLVPPEVPGLTRIDLILGFALAITLAVFVFKYATELYSLKHRPTVG